MRPLPFVLSVLLAGCGGAVVFDETGAGDDGAPGDGGGPSTASSAAATAGGPISATATGGGSTSSGAGAPRIEARIDEVGLGANCMPSVGPDPIAGTVIIEYENLGDAAGSATIERADLVFASASESWVFPIELEPKSSGTIGPGESLTVIHAKVATPGDASFVCQLCGLEGSIQVQLAEPAIGALGLAILACSF